MKLDWHQRISLIIALTALGYLILYSLNKSSSGPNLEVEIAAQLPFWERPNISSMDGSYYVTVINRNQIPVTVHGLSLFVGEVLYPNGQKAPFQVTGTGWNGNLLPFRLEENDAKKIELKVWFSKPSKHVEDFDRFEAQTKLRLTSTIGTFEFPKDVELFSSLDLGVGDLNRKNRKP